MSRQSKISLAIGLTGLIVLLFMYLLPYLFFPHSKDLSLYVSWLLLSGGYTALAVSSLKQILEEGES